MGETLEAAGIVCVPANYDDAGAAVHDVRPTFAFEPQNNYNSAFYRVLVFSDDWANIVVASPVITSANTGIWVEFTPEIDLADGSYWWVVISTPAGWCRRTSRI